MRAAGAPVKLHFSVTPYDRRDTAKVYASARELAERVCGAYDVPMETALADVEEFLQQLRQTGALIEEGGQEKAAYPK